MEFKEFIRRLTYTTKEGKISIMAFISDGQNSVFTCTGNIDIIAQSVAAALSEHPQSMDIISKAIDIMENRNLKVTAINNEDQANDYLIDLYIKNKDLNNGNISL